MNRTPPFTIIWATFTSRLRKLERLKTHGRNLWKSSQRMRLKGSWKPQGPSRAREARHEVPETLHSRGSKGIVAQGARVAGANRRVPRSPGKVRKADQRSARVRS